MVGCTHRTLIFSISVSNQSHIVIKTPSRADLRWVGVLSFSQEDVTAFETGETDRGMIRA